MPLISDIFIFPLITSPLSGILNCRSTIQHAFPTCVSYLQPTPCIPKAQNKNHRARHPRRSLFATPETQHVKHRRERKFKTAFSRHSCTAKEAKSQLRLEKRSSLRRKVDMESQTGKIKGVISSREPERVSQIFHTSGIGNCGFRTRAISTGHNSQGQNQNQMATKSAIFSSNVASSGHSRPFSHISRRRRAEFLDVRNLWECYTAVGTLVRNLCEDG